MSEPLVSVVTPFHNTAPYLAQCIESVLKQTYFDFEYILVDNCSADGSGAIAEQYARRDPRIRFIRRSQLLSQVSNYNCALQEISDGSRYCKVVQADDFIFPECLRSMVQLFEQNKCLGLVSSYWLKGNELRGSGFPYPTSVLDGKEVARRHLRTGLRVFGSPTTVMYRSSLVQKAQPFYDESQLHEDTQKCMEIMKNWDFGFVHQVLSFNRADNESISAAVRDFQPIELDRYITVKRHASTFLDPEEAESLRSASKRTYYAVLAHEVFRARESPFWQYQRRGLSTIGETIEGPYLALQVGRELLWCAGNPVATTARALSVLKRRMRAKSSATDSHASNGKITTPSAEAAQPAKHF